ncbi:MAG: N-acetylmuramic acid 6-phosphate etherase, partial [bacterium]|nr:N-acetylmuramic acid 6-phosphate etherase [bacterium]
PKATKLLAAADGGVKLAIVMHFRKVTKTAAKKLLKQSNNSLRKAIDNG